MARFFIVLFTVLWSSFAMAETHEVLMLNKDQDGNKMVFYPEVIHVKSGDTVKWLAEDRGHNVEMVSTPNDITFKSKLGKDTSLEFTEPGIYYYWCTPHKGMAMIGLVVVDGDTSNIDKVAKAKALGKSKKKLKAFLKELKG